MLKFEADSKGVHLNTLLTNFILSLVKLFLQNHLQKSGIPKYCVRIQPILSHKSYVKSFRYVSW